jgi:hypothetical protein
MAPSPQPQPYGQPGSSSDPYTRPTLPTPFSKQLAPTPPFPLGFPAIADIDAGFGNAEATYLLAKKMIEAGACALQIENQVSDEKQCGHQDGKVTVPHEDFLQKIRACRMALMRYLGDGTDEQEVSSTLPDFSAMRL